ncbi:MAG: hypothetical protein ACOCXH_07945 [Cyclobacteriaceae bacterium]
MIAGLVLSFTLDSFTDFNFAFIGTLSFTVTVVLGYFLSAFEKAKDNAQLKNLTIWTLEDVKGPFVGLKSWPRLWVWAIVLPLVWIFFITMWDWYMFIK